MELRDRVVIVTGGASGIGRALCRRIAEEEPAGIVVADLAEDAAVEVAVEIGGLAVRCDVTSPEEVAELVRRATEAFGPVDVLCSNAGTAVGGGVEADLDGWQRSWDVNVMAHVHLLRELLPQMLERGEGYVIGTVSAAGLLNHILAAPYGATKAAALSLLEWLSIAHHGDGIRVSALCPQGVRTPMLEQDPAGFLLQNALEPEEVADVVVEGLRDERFLILPHPEVAEYFRRRADDHERWLGGMRRLRGGVVDLLAAQAEGHGE
ncbi:MAG: SDR family oxidoreductase [Nitriliruptorales bacterium]